MTPSILLVKNGSAKLKQLVFVTFLLLQYLSESKITLRLSSNIMSNSDDDTNFPNKLLSTKKQVFQKLFQITYRSISETQISKIIQSGRFRGRLLGPFWKRGLQSRKNGLQPLTISVLIPLGWKAAVSAADAVRHQKILGSGTTRLIILNEEIKDIMTIIKFLEDSNLLIKGVSETIQTEAK